MKLRNVGIVATALLVTLGAAAHAQDPTPAPAGKAGRLRPGRQGSRPGRNPGDRVSDRLLREASQRIQRAQLQMRQALPIYDGHRANALELAQIAQWEIKIGLAWDHLKEQGGKQSGPNGGPKEKDGKRGPNISDEQVRKSNAHLVAAGKLLEEALKLLSQAQSDYGGHRVKAGEATQRAIQQLKEALQSV